MAAEDDPAESTVSPKQIKKDGSYGKMFFKSGFMELGVDEAEQCVWWRDEELAHRNRQRNLSLPSRASPRAAGRLGTPPAHFVQFPPSRMEPPLLLLFTDHHAGVGQCGATVQCCPQAVSSMLGTCEPAGWPVPRAGRYAAA